MKVLVTGYSGQLGYDVVQEGKAWIRNDWYKLPRFRYNR